MCDIVIKNNCFMKTLVIDKEKKDFITFWSKNIKLRLLLNSLTGIKAVEYVSNNMQELARTYVMEKGKKIGFWGGKIEKVLIANEIVKGVK